MVIALALITINLAVWYPVLSFWFLGGWEQAWLIGICGYNFNFVCLMQSHGVLMLFNYLLFGWNPSGWYFTALVLHIITVLLIYSFTKILTKSRFIAFIVALIFGVNVAHNDVVTWGSFEGLYALLMVSFLLSIMSYLKYRAVKGSKRYIWLVVSLALFLFGLFIREVALVLPLFLIITEIFLTKFNFSKKNIKHMILVFFPFLIASLIYLLFRSSYGGAPHDFIDGMVQLRISLLGQEQYGEYFWRSLLSFGRFASSHLVPYPLINEARDITARFVYAPVVSSYFFPLVGGVYVLAMGLIMWLFRKDKKKRNLLFFSFLWFLIPTIFFSFAFTITDYELERPLVWNYTRWRYFSFFGTVLFWVTAFWKFYEILKSRHKTRQVFVKWLFVSLVVFVVLVNVFFLRVIQEDIYVNNYKPAKEFYSSLTKAYKTMPEDYVFYYFPFASGLNDRLAEFYYLRREFYPNLVSERRDWTEGHMGMILEQLKNKKIKLSSIIFLDLGQDGSFKDRTIEVSNALLKQKEYIYPIEKNIFANDLRSLPENANHQVDITLDPRLHVEFPYSFEVVASSVLRGERQSGELSEEELLSLRAYSQDRISFLQDASVKVCKTASLGGRSADAMYLLPVNMIDGNIGKRSFWAADCRPAWVVLDLGSIRSVGALAFRGEPNGPNVPSEFRIEVSNDEKNWKVVSGRKQNLDYQDIIVFPEIENARFVRFTADRTTQGGMLMLDSLEVIGEDGLGILNKYAGDYEKLVRDSQSFGYPFLRFSWESAPNNFAPGETLRNNSIFVPVIVDGQKHIYTINPNEGEYYSAAGQFMNRFITRVFLDATGTSHDTFISQVKIAPIYQITRE